MEDVLGIIRIPKAIRFNLLLITIQLQQEHQHYAVMVHIVSAEIDGEPVRTMVVLHSGYSVLFRNK